MLLGISGPCLPVAVGECQPHPQLPVLGEHVFHPHCQRRADAREAVDHEGDQGPVAQVEVLMRSSRIRASIGSSTGVLPDNLRESATADALQEIIDLDLDALSAISPPCGYGRD